MGETQFTRMAATMLTASVKERDDTREISEVPPTNVRGWLYGPGVRRLAGVEALELDHVLDPVTVLSLL